MTILLNFGPNHIFGIGEVRHFKFRVLIDTDYHLLLCMHDRLPPKEMCSRSSDLFYILGKSDNISETVQATVVVTTDH